MESTFFSERQVAFMVIGIGSTNAQVAWGVRVGISQGIVSDLDEDDNSSHSGVPGIEFGPTVYYSLSEKVYLNSGLMLSFKNVKGSGYERYYINDDLKISDWEGKLNLVYLDLPVYLGYAFGTGNTTFYAQAGPVFGLNLSAKGRYTENGTYPFDDKYDAKEDMNSFNAGLGIAVGVNIKKFKIELGYQRGLTNIYKDYENESVKIGSTFLGVSYVF